MYFPRRFYVAHDQNNDTYMSRVLKHIPTEIVMTYVAAEGVLRTSYGASRTQETLLWIIFAFLTVLTPLWLWRVMRVRRRDQLILSTLSVPIWLFALGGPFEYLRWYRPALGSVVLPLYTLFVPIVLRSI
jgi:hypothetical protein